MILTPVLTPVLPTAAAAAAPGAVTPDAAGTSSPGTTGSPAPGGSQWYHESLRLADAHRITRGAGVVVAIIDGGVDDTHPKLVGQVLPGAGIGADAALDGRRDDDPDGHGTAMAGIVAARADVGHPDVWGVAPEAKILPVSSGPEADSEEVARSLRIATDLGADVISMSLGYDGPATDDEERAVEYALAHDVVVVASAGNTEAGDTRVNSPANIPGVLAVTGSDWRGQFWGGSVQGPEAVIAAPGPGVRAPVPTRVSPDGLDTGGGTSNSAAIVAGIVALIRADQPDLDAANVINRLIGTAMDKGPIGRDHQYGFGLVDPVAALTATVPHVKTNPLLAIASPGGPESDRKSLAAAEDSVRASPSSSAAASGTVDDGRGVTTPPLATGTEDNGDDDGTGPSVIGWIAGLGIAVSLGILLGVAAHAQISRRRARVWGRHPLSAFPPIPPRGTARSATPTTDIARPPRGE